MSTALSILMNQLLENKQESKPKTNKPTSSQHNEQTNMHLDKLDEYVTHMQQVSIPPINALPYFIEQQLSENDWHRVLIQKRPSHSYDGRLRDGLFALWCTHYKHFVTTQEGGTIHE